MFLIVKLLVVRDDARLPENHGHTLGALTELFGELMPVKAQNSRRLLGLDHLAWQSVMILSISSRNTSSGSGHADLPTADLPSSPCQQ